MFVIHCNLFPRPQIIGVSSSWNDSNLRFLAAVLARTIIKNKGDVEVLDLKKVFSLKSPSADINADIGDFHMKMSQKDVICYNLRLS